MDIFCKHYDDLSRDELYGILQLRAEVFVVEQNCPYQDLDGNDFNAIHIWAAEAGKIIGCLRVFLKDDGNATIGRVVTKKEVRGTGLGLSLMQEGIRLCWNLYGDTPIVIHAQSYATGFYEKCGFRVSSEEFPEDGIPHHEMTLSFDSPEKD